MTAHTPTTNDLRDAWVDARANSIQQVPLAQAEFERWLAQYKQDVLRGVADKIREEAEYKEVYGCRAMHEAAEIVEEAGND